MARFRKIDPRIWKDESFQKLDPLDKLVALYVLTAQSNRIGLFNFSPAMAAEELGMSHDTCLTRVRHVCQTFNWGLDLGVRVVWIPNWWKYNPPENPSVLMGALSDLHEIPETPLIAKFWANTVDLPEHCLDTWRTRVPTRPPHQEQEQEQYKEQEKERECSSSSGSNFAREAPPKKNNQKPTHPLPHTATDFVLTDELRDWCEAAAPDIDPEAEAEKFRDYYRARGKTFDDWPSQFRTWMRRAIERGLEPRSRSPARRESVEEHNRRVIQELEAMDETAIRIMQGLDPERRS